MTIMKFDLIPGNVARLGSRNVLAVMPSATDRAASPADDPYSVTFPTSRGTLDYITMADRAYIAYDLPQPVVREIFGAGLDLPPETGIDWEGIAIGAFLGGYLIFVSAVLLKLAAFSATFAN